ncbi:MAG: carboxypeptidase-like regulatory domain-containing protein [Bacteroidetes bacterium]|nr:carboxypeptidase-like regulatory domain-containing protein [Bacteroidota bacterium]
MAQSIAQFPFHRYFLALFFLVTWTFVASGQDKATITGKVTDSSKRPLLGVNISVFGKPGGVASDEKGNYELKVDAGLIEVVFSSIGFIPYRETLTITPGQVVTINPVMIISATPLPAVEIKDEQFRRGTFTRIDPRTASQIPNVSGSFEAVLKSMPGVVSNNELSSQYAVRVVIMMRIWCMLTTSKFIVPYSFVPDNRKD